MRAVTVRPDRAGRLQIDDIDEPDPSEGSVLVEAVAVGVCGTDADVVSGAHGAPPAGRDRLVLGHESLGRVLEAGAVTGFHEGDLVVGVVRHPDPVPCASCAVGEWDMCRNGGYLERGIKELDGFMADRWRVEPERAVKVPDSLGALGVLLEPTTVVAKAWEHTIAVGRRAYWEPATVLVTGAGPIGLLAALLGVQRGLDVHVFDRAAEGPKVDAVRALGATPHHGELADLELEPDVVLECTGAGEVVVAATELTAPGGVTCLTGLGDTGDLDVPGGLASDIVLGNKAVVGSVNANLRHYHQATQALRRADHAWLARLVTRRVRPEEAAAALERQPGDIKVVVDFAP